MKEIPEFFVEYQRKPLPEQEFGDCGHEPLKAKTTIEAKKEAEKFFTDTVEKVLIVRKRIALYESPWYAACKDEWVGENKEECWLGKKEEEILYLNYLQTEDGKHWQVVYNDTDPYVWGRYFPEEEVFIMSYKPKKWLTNW